MGYGRPDGLKQVLGHLGNCFGRGEEGKKPVNSVKYNK